MKLAKLAFLAFVAALTFLVLFIADRERHEGVQRLSDYKISSRPGLDRTQPVNTMKNP
jgi:hypothetical protein